MRPRLWVWHPGRRRYATGGQVRSSPTAICAKYRSKILCSLVIGIDTDPDALKIARENIDATELENEVDLVCARLADLTEEDVGLLSRFNGFFDTVSSYVSFTVVSLTLEQVVMNPPYGTKTVSRVQ